MSAPIDDLLRHCRRLGLSADIGTMFRSPALRYEGKAFAFQGHEGGVIVKLPNERITELADDDIAHPVTMGKRTMREWAEVPPTVEPDMLESLVVEAHRFTSSQR